MNLATTLPNTRTMITCVGALALVAAACGGGSDDAADTTVAVTDPAPVETDLWPPNRLRRIRRRPKRR